MSIKDWKKNSLKFAIKFSKQLNKKRFFLKKRKKKLIKKNYNFFDFSKGSNVLINKSLLYNGYFLILQHQIKKGYKFRQFLYLLNFLCILKLISKKPIDFLFLLLFKRIIPLFIFLPKTYGRTVLKIPVRSFMPFNLNKAIHKLVTFSVSRHEETPALRLVGEVLQSLKCTSQTIKWKQDLHLEAFSNRSNIIQLRYY